MKQNNEKEFEIEEAPLEEDIPSDIEVIEGIYQNEKVFLPNNSISLQLHDKNYFGTLTTDNRIELEVLEALLLMERSRINIVSINNESLSAEKLLSQHVKSDERIWEKYLVYRDLRQRGYMVRLGYGEGIDFRVFPRGSTQSEGIAKYFIFILDESNPVHLLKLDKITQQTLNARKELILAIVDRLGEPTYYQLEQFKLKINEKRENLI